MNQQELQALVTYRDGCLYWNNAMCNNNIKAGSRAGYFHGASGYYKVRYGKTDRFIHRWIFLYHHGYLPEFVDHIDNDRSNNLIGNLREATRQQNAFNRRSQPNSSSKYKGVSWHKRAKKWCANGTINGKQKSLGYFDTEEAAAKRYDFIMEKYHKEFMRPNFPCHPNPSE